MSSKFKEQWLSNKDNMSIYGRQLSCSGCDTTCLRAFSAYYGLIFTDNGLRESQFLTKSDLIQQGWTEHKIKKYLKNEDIFFCRERKVYLVGSVEEIVLLMPNCKFKEKLIIRKILC